MASIDPRLLTILACPWCQGGLVAVESEQTLECAKCDRSYLVRAEGVPIMMVKDD